MLHRRVNGYDMAYIELGEGPPLVCVHGSLGDFRVWSSVLGPLSRQHRVVSLSLRHFFPEHWDGVGTGYTIAQHVADVIGFIEALGDGPVDLMGHSRGGHIAFRVAQHRPDLLRRVVLAEPGGDLDASLAPPGAAPPPMRGYHGGGRGEDRGGRRRWWRWRSSSTRSTARVPGALCPPTRSRNCATTRYTLLGQVNEQRQPFTRADAEAIRVPTLFVGGARHAGVAADGAAGAGGACARRAGRDDPERHALHVRAGSGAVLRGGDGVPGGMKWGASVARCPPNRAYRLCSDSEHLCVIIGTCHMAR